MLQNVYIFLPYIRATRTASIYRNEEITLLSPCVLHDSPIFTTPPNPRHGRIFLRRLRRGGGASATVCDGHVGVRSTFMAALHLEEASTRESANIYADNVFVSRDRDL